MAAPQERSRPFDISQVKSLDRLEKYEAILHTIPHNEVRVQTLGSTIVSITGLVTLEGLPFYFEGWSSSPPRRELEFLRGTNPEYPTGRIVTDWSANVPRPPQEFRPARNVKRLGDKEKEGFADVIDDIDMESILRVFKVGEATISKARKTGSLLPLCQEKLKSKKPKYEQFLQKYRQDPVLQGAYGAAVAVTCDKAASEYRAQNSRPPQLIVDLAKHK